MNEERIKVNSNLIALDINVDNEIIKMDFNGNLEEDYRNLLSQISNKSYINEKDKSIISDSLGEIRYAAYSMLIKIVKDNLINYIIHFENNKELDKINLFNLYLLNKLNRNKEDTLLIYDNIRILLHDYCDNNGCIIIIGYNDTHSR